MTRESPIWTPSGDTVVCQHGAPIDIHCCGCHSGFLFFPESCTCLDDTDPEDERKAA